MKSKSRRFGSSLRCRVWRLGFHPWGSRSWQCLLLRLNAQETLPWKGGFIRGMIQALLNTIWHSNFEIEAWKCGKRGLRQRNDRGPTSIILFCTPTLKLRLGTPGGRRWLVQRLTCADLDHCVHRARISCLVCRHVRALGLALSVCVRPRGAWQDDDPSAGSKCDLCRELC